MIILLHKSDILIENYQSNLAKNCSVLNHTECTNGYCTWAFEIIPWDSGKHA